MLPKHEHPDSGAISMRIKNCWHGTATWLLSESDPDDPDRLFGLCDLGLGFPELGYVSLAEIITLRGKLGLPIERDQHFHRRQATLGLCG